VGHVAHTISPGLCPATPVAAPTHLYYPAGTMAPGPVLTTLPSHADFDRNLHWFGMDRSILPDVPHIQTHSDVQDQAGGHSHSSSPHTSCTCYVHKRSSYGASFKGAADAMTHLAWNC
jgi:hypothetical protein